MRRGRPVALLGALLAALPLAAQSFTQRGFLDTRVFAYPQAAANDSGRLIVESLFRYEAVRRLAPGLTLSGAFDARTDSHRQVRRTPAVTWDDRTLQRPAFALRRLSLLYRRGGLAVEAGRQFIRWGKADLLNPTDRFAPRDFLTVTDNEFLAVNAVRVTWERNSDTLDAVWVPWFTPSRTPLLNQRWTVVPDELRGVPLRDAGAAYPGGGQFGLRWNHVGRGYEASLSAYEGRNQLPLLDVFVQPTPLEVSVRRRYPRLRLVGADAAVPLRWVTLKGEAAWFTSKTQDADEFVLYVAQAERQVGELFLVGGYAGEVVTARRNPFFFAPDRGFARSFLGRVSYTLDARRNVAFEAVVRRGGDGVYGRAEFSQLLGQHWRATVGVSVFGGRRSDFLGQYRRNSFGNLALRYSF